MKNFTLFALYNNKIKNIGAVISFLSIFLVIIDNTSLITISKLHLELLNWLIVFGLFILSFSKEKIDDERVQKTRYFALKGVFMLFISTLLAFIFVDITSLIEEKPNYLSIILGVLVTYLIIFNTSLYFDWKTIYNKEDVSSNIKNNPKFYILYIILSVLSVILFYFTT